MRDLNAREGIPIDIICAKMKICSRAYFEWLVCPVTRREQEETQIHKLLVKAHENDPGAGYRILHDDIQKDLLRIGLSASRNRVARICSKYKIFANHSNIHAQKSVHKKAPRPSHDDLLRRKFKADTPNRVWVTDITEHPTQEGKVYWCGFKDLCSMRIVGHAASSRMTTELVICALSDALIKRGHPAGVIIHSDRGGQYNSRQFLALLEQKRLTGSMGQVKTCADNAAMESFNALLQKNVLNRQRVWATRSELIYRIYRWVNIRYNKQRRQESLGRMTPEEYELINFGIIHHNAETTERWSLPERAI